MKVKIISVKHDVLNVSIDGTPYSYVIGRAQPLTPQDLLSYFDNRILTNLTMISQALVYNRSWLDNLFGWFRSWFPKSQPKAFGLADIPLMCVEFARCVRQNAVPIDIDGQKCFVVTPDILDKLEKGEF